MAKYDYGHFNNKQIKDIQSIQKEMSAYGNCKGITTADSRPRNIQGPVNREHVESAVGLVKTVLGLFW
jgi:hypothetical protein